MNAAKNIKDMTFGNFKTIARIYRSSLSLSKRSKDCFILDPVLHQKWFLVDHSLFHHGYSLTYFRLVSFSRYFMYFILLLFCMFWSSVQFFCSTDLEYLRLQYWATFACGFSVLGFLGYRLWQLPNNIQPISARTTRDVKFILSCLALCGTVCCVLFATKYHIGNLSILLLL